MQNTSTPTNTYTTAPILKHTKHTHKRTHTQTAKGKRLNREKQQPDPIHHFLKWLRDNFIFPHSLLFSPPASPLSLPPGPLQDSVGGFEGLLGRLTLTTLSMPSPSPRRRCLSQSNSSCPGLVCASEQEGSLTTPAPRSSSSPVTCSTS